MTCEVDYDINNPPKSINTKFGKARINTNGYYQITTCKDGNKHKLLHRLIFEDFYNISINKEFPNQKMVVHHIDENKLNNNISNLDIMSVTEHRKLHTAGDKHPMLNKHHTDEAKKKISKVHLNKNVSETSKQLMSKYRNTTGFFRVYKRNDPTCTQGFVWAYRFYINSKNRKVYSRVNLLKLMETIITKGLPWKIIDENNARQTCEQYGYDFDKLNIEVN